MKKERKLELLQQNRRNEEIAAIGVMKEAEKKSFFEKSKVPNLASDKLVIHTNQAALRAKAAIDMGPDLQAKYKIARKQLKTLMASVLYSKADLDQEVLNRK